MKKVLLIIFVCALSFNALGQNNQKIRMINFYGVDFTKVGILGADESADKFIAAFNGINGLFIAEPEKYDVKKFLRLREVNIDISTATDRLKGVDMEQLLTPKKGNELTESEVSTILSAYGNGGNGWGMVIIASELNKSAGLGTYYYVIFNEATKETASIKKITGKAKGFGLRNYWARSVYETLRLWY